MGELEAHDRRLLALWLRFLRSFAQAEDLGDASGDVRRLATLLGLPQPPGEAGFAEWVVWVRDQYGVDENLAALALREFEAGVPLPKPAPTLHDRLSSYLRYRGF